MRGTYNPYCNPKAGNEKYYIDESKDINNFISDCKTDKNIIVYRGLKNIKFLKDIYQGDGTYKDKAFMSTSIDKEVSRNFTFKKTKYTMKIYIPKGTNCISRDSHEQEILINSKAVFKIINYNIFNNIFECVILNKQI